jgi:hypothetical protein
MLYFDREETHEILVSPIVDREDLSIIHLKSEVQSLKNSNETYQTQINDVMKEGIRSKPRGMK